MTLHEPQTHAEMRAAHKARMARWGLSPKPVTIKSYERGRRLYGAPIGPEVPFDWVVMKRRRDAILSLDERPVPCLKEIREVVARVCGVSVSVMAGPKRYQPEVKARFIYYWIARNYTPRSYPEIGRAVGGKDHSTVMHGVRVVNGDRAKFEPFISQALAHMRLA